MPAEPWTPIYPRPPKGLGQVVLPPVGPEIAPATQVRLLYRLSDPSLSELGLEEFLDELLNRVQEALGVDTVAILLYDAENQHLVARAAKGVEEEVEAGVQIPIGVGFAGRIAQERVAIFIADVDRADILNPILSQKGIRSLLGVPLIVEGDLIGVLHVGSMKARTFGQQDLALLQVAAARAAPGIERARLYSALEHEHRSAMILQRSLLPKKLVEVLGVEAAARYLPATDEVGGDWYDLFELPGGQLGIAIGDVVGHGLPAAALMGQLRTALHAYALAGNSPGRTLELLDRFLQSMPDFAMATAAYGVLDPETGRLSLASAGHLPPVVVSARGARQLDVEPSTPLGAMSFGHRAELELRLEFGETLVLYTDGLVERPGVPVTDSIEVLVQTLAPARSAEEACQLAMQLIPVEGLGDDLAVVALQNSEIPEVLELYPAARPDELAEIRRNIRRWLRNHGASDDEVTEITLAANEACANAVEHAYSPAPNQFSFVATAEGGLVSITVTDTGSWRQPRGVDRGRGLRIIDAAMDTVEIRESAAGGTEIRMTRRLST
ncbi:MAG TPA: SpoIIE family protein phosphatase [Solirubrobacteraceae bacterium]|nr:SpoIIE family protein phosphatase [Solirubrobacteraceae bacterium]